MVSAASDGRKRIHQVPRPGTARLRPHLRLDRERLAGPDSVLVLFFLVVVHPAEEGVHLAADRVVHAEQVLILPQAAGIVVEVADVARIRCGRKVRIAGDSRVDLQHVGAQRLPQRLRNYVAGEGQAVDDVAGAVALDGPGLEDRARLELRGIRHVGVQQERAEVSAHDLCVGDVGVGAGGQDAPRHFAVVEEEQLLVLHGWRVSAPVPNR